MTRRLHCSTSSNQLLLPFVLSTRCSRGLARISGSPEELNKLGEALERSGARDEAFHIFKKAAVQLPYNLTIANNYYNALFSRLKAQDNVTVHSSNPAVLQMDGDRCIER